MMSDRGQTWMTTMHRVKTGLLLAFVAVGVLAPSWGHAQAYDPNEPISVTIRKARDRNFQWMHEMEARGNATARRQTAEIIAKKKAAKRSARVRNCRACAGTGVRQQGQCVADAVRGRNIPECVICDGGKPVCMVCRTDEWEYGWANARRNLAIGRASLVHARMQQWEANHAAWKREMDHQNRLSQELAYGNLGARQRADLVKKYNESVDRLYKLDPSRSVLQ